jgi:hypothetical protein
MCVEAPYRRAPTGTYGLVVAHVKTKFLAAIRTAHLFELLPLVAVQDLRQWSGQAPSLQQLTPLWSKMRLADRFANIAYGTGIELYRSRKDGGMEETCTGFFAAASGIADAENARTEH